MALIFENKGEAYIEGLTIMGLNAKNDSRNAIGFFGTGFKHATARLLREGASIEVQIGLDVYDIETRSTTVRGKEFDKLIMKHRASGEITPLQITTELGKTWLPWMCAREYYANALDEGADYNMAMQHATDEVMVRPEEDVTRVIVRNCRAVEDVYARRHEYFLSPEELSTARYTLADGDRSTVQIWDNRPGGVFCNGINVTPKNIAFRLRYNVTPDLISLSEERILNSHYNMEAMIKRAVVCTSIDHCNLFRLLAIQTEGYSWESQLSWSFIHGSVQPEHWIVERARNIYARERLDYTRDAQEFLELIIKKFGSARDLYTHLEFTKAQRRKIERCIAIIRRRLQLECNAPIELVASLSRNVYAMAENNRVLLVPETFDMGTSFLFATLYEEFLHIEKRFSDCTRDMQNYLFQKIAALVEEIEEEDL